MACSSHAGIKNRDTVPPSGNLEENVPSIWGIMCGLGIVLAFWRSSCEIAGIMPSEFAGSPHTGQEGGNDDLLRSIFTNSLFFTAQHSYSLQLSCSFDSV
jgi:hypothetical protein